MIFDDLENLNQYYGLFDNLDRAIAYIDENGLEGLPDGRTDIDGDDVYVTVGPRAPGPAGEAPFETHSRYMDIHVVLEGSELAETALGELTARRPYDEAADTALWDAATSAALVLAPGRFAVFMVEEPHKPDVRAEGCEALRKAVFKVKY